VSYDGSSSGVSPVGHGLDGAVHSMALFKSNTSHKALLVVGGSFYSAITNATALVRGGLAGWDASSREWVLLGSRPFFGRADVVLANASHSLYVAGTSSLGEHVSSLLSRFDGSSWSTPVSALDEYISEGSIEALSISPRGDLIIGGAFSWSHKEAFLARWDGRNFHKLKVDGRVRCMAGNAFAVYVGGDFGLAVYQDSSGIQTLFTAASSAAVYGSVASLAVADHASSCIYITGALVDATTGRSASLARRCLAAGSPSFEMAAFGQGDQNRLHSLALQAVQAS